MTRVIELSIVIPSYNTARMTSDCCRAVLATMPGDTEIIVVDDGSSDHTAELLAKEAAQVRVVRLAQNSGFAKAANAGVAATSGRIVVLLNSDAIVQPNALDAFRNAFDADASLGIAGAQLLNEDGTKQWSGGPTPTLAWMIGAVSGLGRHAKLFRRRDGPRTIDWVSGAAMAIRREAWEAAGPLNEQYRFYCQDIDLCLRARDAGWRVRIVDDARVVHGLGKTIGANDYKWSDLLTWGRARYGKRWAFFARWLLVAFKAIRKS